ncbi:MAG TPA: CpsD/CapB family tyrosine-protein kinase [Candidatus Acidoferrales bacterium]|nr:CpsD/CapB family tyrosine-protein kinase [Candidatus Acidoferrales bacterium]
MSRNFELLQNLGREREMFEAPAVTDTVVEVPPPVSVAPVAVELQPLQLPMEESQRDEMFKLVQRVFLVPGAGRGRMVVVSGLEAGNGCSWICARMGEVLASQVSGSVCVVDANLRSPGLHKEFNVPNHYGLTDALQVTEPIRRFVTALSRPNLWLLSCGADVEGLQAMLSSDRMRSILPELQREFDYVLIDAPSMDSGDDSIMLGRNAEGVVLVLRAHASRRETARKAVRDLETSNVRVLGAVLNRRTFPVPESIYRKL